MNKIFHAAMRAWESSPARYHMEFAVWLELEKMAGRFWGG